jgi:hypothetical protein
MEWMEPNFILSLILSGVGVVIWLVRLEGKIINQKEQCENCRRHLEECNAETQKDIDFVRAKQEVLDEKVAEGLKEIAIELAQIKGYLANRGIKIDADK